MSRLGDITPDKKFNNLFLQSGQDVIFNEQSNWDIAAFLTCGGGIFKKHLKIEKGLHLGHTEKNVNGMMRFNDITQNLEVCSNNQFEPLVPGIHTLWSMDDNQKDIFYDTGKVGIGTSAPERMLDINGDVDIRKRLFVKKNVFLDEGGVKLGFAQDQVEGMIRFNSDTKEFEGFNGSDWVKLG